MRLLHSLNLLILLYMECDDVSITFASTRATKRVILSNISHEVLMSSGIFYSLKSSNFLFIPAYNKFKFSHIDNPLSDYDFT